MARNYSSTPHSVPPGITQLPVKVFLENFGQLYVSKFLADFLIVSKDGKDILVHRTVLAARSDVFAAMFRMEKSKENLTGRSEVADVDSDTLEDLFRFLYGCYTTHDGICNDPGKLLVAADKYNVTSLIPMCGTALEKELNGKNAGDTVVLAEMYGLSDLKIASIKCALKNLQEFLLSGQLEVVRDYSADLARNIIARVPNIANPVVERSSTVHIPRLSFDASIIDDSSDDSE